MPIHNFHPKQFKGAPQSWDAVQASNGLLYIANTEGILEYDGTQWRLIPITDNTSAGELQIDKQETIYVGGNNQIGYLKSDSNGQMSYKSLNHLLDSNLQYASIRWMHEFQDKILFITYKEIFAYSPQENRVEHIPSNSDFRGSFIIGNKLYIKELEGGLLEWDGKSSIKKAAHHHLFQGIDFVTALPYQDHKAIIGGVEHVYLYDPTADESQALQQITMEDQKLIEKYQIYNLKMSPKGNFVWALSGGGVLITDQNGKTIRRITKEDGLFSNSILCVFYDSQHTLWVLTSDCISKVEENEPITYWNSDDGLNGVVIDALRYQGKLYITTLSTAYRLEGNKIKPIQGMGFEQHWNMINFKTPDKDVLLMGTESGVWEFNGHKSKRLIASGRHAVSMKQSLKNPNLVYVGWANRFAALRYHNGRWNNLGFINNLNEDVRSIEEDKEGNLWLGTFRHGFVKITLSDQWVSPKEIRYYQLKEGLPTLKNAMVFRYQNRLIFASEKGFLRYDSSSDSFIPDCSFGNRFCKDGYDIYGFAELSKNQVAVTGLFTKKSKPGIITIDDTITWLAEPFSKVPEMFAISIYHEPSGVSWLCGSEGLFRYDGNIEKTYHTTYPSLIRKVNIGEDSTIFWGAGETPPITFPYKHNSLTFFYSSPDFESMEDKQYQHWLEGYETGWSHWSNDSKKEYTNLPEGEYKFKVKSKNIYGNQTAVASYSFFISPPWFRTYWAYSLYVLGVIILMVGIVRFNAQRLKRDKTKLSKLVSERTAELESQKEEIKTQAESLQRANSKINKQKDELERAYQSIRLLSELGQQLNSTFDTEKLLTYIHQYVGKFMDTTVFAVGILEREGSLFYQLAVENGVRLKPFSRKLKEKNQFAVWCLTNKIPIIIHDVSKEYHQYIDEYAPETAKTVSGEQLQSLIFYPLLIHDEALGVMTVQSHAAHAYSDNDLDVLSNLASYVATSLNNANAFHIIEDKNEDITASIRYANTIQQAILPSREGFKKSFDEFFIFFRPKDIVSGDFYWLVHIEPNEEKWRGEIKNPITFLAVVDCTGHGVPGAFMSMIGNTLLNEIVIQNHIIEPAQILESLDARVKEVLHQDENANDDGMEVGLCLVEDLQDGNFQVSFTGAKRAFYYWQQENNDFNYIEGNRRAIGGIFSNDSPFSTFSATLKKGDVFYMASDGLADQNRYGSSRKFGSKRMKAFFAKFSHLPMAEINSILNNTYDRFTQGSEQRDDITVIGIRL